MSPLRRSPEPAVRVKRPYPANAPIVNSVNPRPMDRQVPRSAALPERICTLVTLAPSPPLGVVDSAAGGIVGKTDAGAAAGLLRRFLGARGQARTARTARTARMPWWRWLDFDSKLHAQIWLIASAQIVILVVAGLVIHASSGSPY